MVCNTFVCRIMKEAGVFLKYGDINFNCNELTIFDMLKLNIFEKNFERPKQCLEADPENPLCQLGGNKFFNLIIYAKFILI